MANTRMEYSETGSILDDVATDALDAELTEFDEFLKEPYPSVEISSSSASSSSSGMMQNYPITFGMIDIEVASQSTDEGKSESEKESKNNYRCSCDIKYPCVWMINNQSKVKICEKCKKGQFEVKCTAQVHCDACQGRNSEKSCEISLKFRMRPKTKRTFGEKSMMLSIFVFQNVLEKFSVIPSAKRNKKRKTRDEDSSISSSSPSSSSRARARSSSNKKPKLSFEQLIDSKQHLLPFTWNELVEMKRISS